MIRMRTGADSDSGEDGDEDSSGSESDGGMATKVVAIDEEQKAELRRAQAKARFEAKKREK